MADNRQNLANQILSYSRERLTVALPLFDHALLRLPAVTDAPEIPDGQPMRCGTDGKQIFWEADDVLQLFRKNPELIEHKLLHMVLHCLYTHMYAYDRLENDVWDVACDIAVEHVIDRLGILPKEKDLKERQAEVKELLEPYVQDLLAEQIYRLLCKEENLKQQVLEKADAFCFDLHRFWEKKHYEQPDGDLTIYTRAGSHFEEKREWDQIFQTISLLKEERSLYEGSQAGTQTVFLGTLSPALHDYAKILRKFAVLEEETELDPDAFDLIFYTYGLSLYGDLPLIEPLEYKESFKIRQLVIAIDTSGSCQGEKVQTFLRNTCSILAGQQSFFDRFMVYIIQCDSKIQKEEMITSREEFERFRCDVEINGAGGTDFRPVFSRIKELTDNGFFHSLQGLLYFTDGLGQYPEETPGFKTLFIYPAEKERRYPTPSWADSYVIKPETAERYV